MGKRGINSWPKNEPCWRTQCIEDGHNTENNTWQHLECWTIRYTLILEGGLILKGDRIVVPEALKHPVFKILYTCHQDKTKCSLLASESIFWPGKNQSIKNMVKICTICSKYQPVQPKLLLMQPDLPTYPWATIDMDVCEQDQCKYLWVVDYYSRFPVFITLPDTSATTVCEHFTQVLTKYELSTIIMYDHCSQYMNERFKREFHNSNIIPKTSTPYHHQTNGVVERTIGTLKVLLKKAQQKKKCPYTALWMYRTIPKKKEYVILIWTTV